VIKLYPPSLLRGQELMAGARDVVLKTVEQSNSEEKMDRSVMSGRDGRWNFSRY